jgi:hypothetical protein
MGGLDWRFPSSDAVVKYAYDREARQLYVVFTGGGLYRYLGIPPREIARMEGAESLGTFVNQEIKEIKEIKPNYDGERREADGRFTPVPRVGRPREAARRERARKAPPASPKRKPSAQREPRPAIGPRA